MQKRYIIISPVRNEEEYVEKTLRSVVNQTVLPSEWIIVNDGSDDGTVKIIEPYLKKYDWIKLVTVPNRGYYLPGTGVVNVFYKGYENISDKNWDFLVKLDCDLSFSETYFHDLLEEFNKDPKLGIASGCIYNVINGKLMREKSQKDHPFGASKMYRRECFKSIGGIKPVPGWDLADLLSAQMNGWNTRCFFDMEVAHYKIGGVRRTGLTKGKFLQGRFQYRFGYTFFYTLLKSLYHLTSRPFIISGVGLITGYIYAAFNKEERYFDREMIKYMRKRHRAYLLSKLNIHISK
ncbi:MAG: glycosyltransferase family A protein [Bacteroidales bacterium]